MPAMTTPRIITPQLISAAISRPLDVTPPVEFACALLALRPTVGCAKLTLVGCGAVDPPPWFAPALPPLLSVGSGVSVGVSSTLAGVSVGATMGVSVATGGVSVATRAGCPWE